MLTTSSLLFALNKESNNNFVPYTPQQNGVAERKNRTLKEMANCMIQSKGLSLQYWAEAINCANYIVNRTPTNVLQGITPEEAWSKIKPTNFGVRSFGSTLTETRIYGQFDR